MKWIYIYIWMIMNADSRRRRKPNRIEIEGWVYHIKRAGNSWPVHHFQCWTGCVWKIGTSEDRRQGLLEQGQNCAYFHSVSTSFLDCCCVLNVDSHFVKDAFPSNVVDVRKLAKSLSWEHFRQGIGMAIKFASPLWPTPMISNVCLEARQALENAPLLILMGEYLKLNFRNDIVRRGAVFFYRFLPSGRKLNLLRYD